MPLSPSLRLSFSRYILNVYIKYQYANDISKMSTHENWCSRQVAASEHHSIWKSSKRSHLTVFIFQNRTIWIFAPKISINKCNFGGWILKWDNFSNFQTTVKYWDHFWKIWISLKLAAWFLVGKYEFSEKTEDLFFHGGFLVCQA